MQDMTVFVKVAINNNDADMKQFNRKIIYLLI